MYINLIFEEVPKSTSNSKFQIVIQDYQNCTWNVKLMVYVNIDQIILSKAEIWVKMFNFEDKIGLLVQKIFILVKKTTPVHERIFQIWQLGTELPDKMFNFEDNIGLLLLKMIVLKTQLLFEMEFFKSEWLEESYGTKHSILKIT